MVGLTRLNLLSNLDIKIMRYFLIISSILILASAAHSQEMRLIDSSYIPANMQIEKILESDTQDEEADKNAEEIIQLENNPLDLNTASVEELHRIPGLSCLIAYRIADKRKILPFVSVDDLLSIEGMSPEMFSSVKRYLKVERGKKNLN